MNRQAKQIWAILSPQFFCVELLRICSFGLGRWSEQCTERLTVGNIEMLLATPRFHKPTPSGCSFKRHETVQRQVPLQIVQGVTHDLETMAVRAGRTVVERGIEWMATSPTKGGAASFGSVKNERYF
jgi:hypothetical protein